MSEENTTAVNSAVQGQPTDPIMEAAQRKFDDDLKDFKSKKIAGLINHRKLLDERKKHDDEVYEDRLKDIAAEIEHYKKATHIPRPEGAVEKDY